MSNIIVYAVYHDVNKEARSKELLQCCQMLGKVIFVSYALPTGFKNVTSHIIDKSSMFALINFLYLAKKVINDIKPNIVVLHDNDCAALIPFIKKHHPSAKLIYDSSELYIEKKTLRFEKPFFGNDGILIWLKSKFTSFRKYYEKKYLKHADLVMVCPQSLYQLVS